MQAKSSTKPSLVYSGLHGIGTTVVQIVCYLLVTVVIARVLGPERKGEYDLSLATAGLLTSLIGFSLPSGVTYVVARGNINLAMLIRRISLICIAQGVLIFGVLLVVNQSPWAASFLPPRLGPWVVLVVAFSSLFDMLRSVWRAILAGEREFIRANYSDLSKQAFGLFLLIALPGLVYLFKIKINMVVLLLLVNVFASVLAGIVSLRFISAGVRAIFEGGSDGIMSVIQYSAFGALANILQFLNYRLSAFIVNSLTGPKDLGLFQTAATISQLLWLVPGTAASLLLPVVAAKGEDPAQTATRTATIVRIVFWFTVCIAIILAFSAIGLLPLVLGTAFRDSISPLLCLLPGVVFFVVTMVLSGHIAGLGKPYLNLGVSFASLILVAPLCLLLIPRWGIIGAAIANSAAYILSTLLTVNIFCSLEKKPLRELFLLCSDDVALLRQLLARTSSFVLLWRHR